jgi:hypothetical protein
VQGHVWERTRAGSALGENTCRVRSGREHVQGHVWERTRAGSDLGENTCRVTSGREHVHMFLALGVFAASGLYVPCTDRMGPRACVDYVTVRTFDNPWDSLSAMFHGALAELRVLPGARTDVVG